MPGFLLTNDWVALARPYKNQPDPQHFIVHKIKVPNRNDQLSILSFKNGIRSFATKEDKDITKYRNSVPFGPKCEYNIYRESGWKDDVQFWQDAYAPASEANRAARWPDSPWNTITNYIQYRYAIDTGEVNDIPFVGHVSVYDFYKYIGFDHKRRCYVDQNNQPLKYSVPD